MRNNFYSFFNLHNFGIFAKNPMHHQKKKLFRFGILDLLNVLNVLLAKLVN